MTGGPDWRDVSGLAADALVAGCDEAGRGPLAGPVVAAAVILPYGLCLPGLDDSKKLSASQRDRLYREVRQSAVAVGVGLAWSDEIDRVNILQASLLAMRRSVAALSSRPELVLVDGNREVPALGLPQRALVKGDARAVPVAAAAIIAKVTRDTIMERLDRLYPGYGLASHKGYPCPAHLAALRELGASPVHRRSFGPVRSVLSAPPPLPPAACRGGQAVQLALFEADDAR